MNEMTDTPALDRLPLLPRDREGPVFAEAWQAQAFAMTVELSRQGRFTWSEWAQALAAEIAAAQARGDADLGDTYYHHWLAALERLVAAKDLVGANDLAARKEAWREAAAHTEFGQPIVLDRDRSAYS
jgi:nitrile hydratase accessory protein